MPLPGPKYVSRLTSHLSRLTFTVHPSFARMQPPIFIRRATPADLPTLLAFEQGIIATERPFDPTLKPDPINYYDLEEMIGQPEVEVAVAEWNGSVIASGFARIENAKPYLAHEKHAYLGFMYVSPEHRGKRVNKLIIEYLKCWALTQNITELRLDVYAQNASAIQAYEKTGFSKHMIEMRMSTKK